MNKQNILLLLILSVIIILLLLNKCDNDIPTRIDTKIETVYSRDTLIVYDTIILTNTKSIIKTDENKVYDDSLHSNNYYQQTFKDSTYLLQTFGGFVDSISLDIYNKNIIITDSITKTITNTQYIKSNGLYVGFNVNVLEKSLVAPEATISYQFKNQSMINVGVGIFNKQPFYSVGFKIKI